MYYNIILTISYFILNNIINVKCSLYKRIKLLSSMFVYIFLFVFCCCKKYLVREFLEIARKNQDVLSLFLTIEFRFGIPLRPVIRKTSGSFASNMFSLD